MKGDAGSGLEHGLRFDLIIAVCALLISALAAGASWWQARLVAAQTHVVEVQTRVLQEQLGAQVWPYVGVSSDFHNDTAEIAIENDGLGPAVLRSESVALDGRPQRSFIDVLHMVLGANITSRKPHGEHFGLTLNSFSPGDVLRPGQTTVLFAVTSKSFATPIAKAFGRIDISVCYCAIVPGNCWQEATKSSGPPDRMRFCREVPGDLLHAPMTSLLNRKL